MCVIIKKDEETFEEYSRRYHHDHVDDVRRRHEEMGRRARGEPSERAEAAQQVVDAIESATGVDLPKLSLAKRLSRSFSRRFSPPSPH